MKLRFTSRAYRDREAIFNYLNERSPAAARKVMSRLRQAAALLKTQPLQAPATDSEGVRVLFVGKYPYKIFYRVRGDAIEVVHIRHTSRQPSEFER
jgi:addiction module RelE/StbE family toxin